MGKTEATKVERPQERVQVDSLRLEDSTRFVSLLESGGVSLERSVLV